MKSLFETEGYKDVLNRIEKLNDASKPTWGTMDINQMLKHCQGPLEVGIGKKELTGNIGFMKKMVFKSVMWGVIGVLLVLLILFIYKYKNSNTITVTSNARLAEIEEEFEGHKKRSLEREQVLRRKLQDEINKQKYGD